jgi:hypothetical protein
MYIAAWNTGCGLVEFRPTFEPQLLVDFRSSAPVERNWYSCQYLKEAELQNRLQRIPTKSDLWKATGFAGHSIWLHQPLLTLLSYDAVDE